MPRQHAPSTEIPGVSASGSDLHRQDKPRVENQVPYVREATEGGVPRHLRPVSGCRGSAFRCPKGSPRRKHPACRAPLPSPPSGHAFFADQEPYVKSALQVAENNGSSVRGAFVLCEVGPDGRGRGCPPLRGGSYARRDPPEVRERSQPSSSWPCSPPGNREPARARRASSLWLPWPCGDVQDLRTGSRGPLRVLEIAPGARARPPAP
jgi:hypothetical protein